jgi:hypothetical protein
VPSEELYIDSLLSINPLFKLLEADHIEECLRNDLTNSSLNCLTLELALLHPLIKSLTSIFHPVLESQCSTGTAFLQFDSAQITKSGGEASVSKLAFEVFFGRI